MKKQVLLVMSALLSLTLLCGCRGQSGPETSGSGASSSVPRSKTPQEILAEQTVDESHDAFLVDTGGSLGTLLVTAERGEQSLKSELGGYYVAISVWNPQNLESPIQRMETEAESVAFGHHEVVDANFDGHPDFGCMWFQGNQPTYWHYWIWDEQAGRFAAEPGFDEISAPVFDTETGVISGWARDSAADTGVNTFHKWIDGELVCMRRIEAFFSDEGDWSDILLTVEDRIDGEMIEVFHEEYPMDPMEWYEQREKWINLDYHGENSRIAD